MNDDTESSHEVGDTKTVPAEASASPESKEVHEIELVDPPGRIGYYWKCERCMMFYINPEFFDRTPCTPWGTVG